MRRSTSAILLLAVIAAGVLAAMWQSGGYSTRSAPTALERVIVRAARRAAVPSKARSMGNPVSFSSKVFAEAQAHFADHCASCHANDGSGLTEIGPNLYPRAPDMRLADTQNLTDGELYWIIANGVRLTGMPAWGPGGDNDADTWKLVHFIRRLKDLTPDQLTAMEALNPKTDAEREEERQDDQFLSGQDPTPAPPGHQH